MRKGIYILPNSLTVTGMFFGFMSIITSMKGDFERAAWYILIAMLFDAMDGWVARLTKTTSRFGLELDSLSDVISFGVAPALMVYIWSLNSFGKVGWLGAFVFVACGALRLARFNVQMVGSEKKYFTGLPIPGAAGLLATYVLFHHETIGSESISNDVPLVIMVYVSAFLMISRVKFHSIKELNIRDRRPFWMLPIALGILYAVAMNPPVVLFGVCVVYVIWAMLEFLLTFPKRRAKIKSQKKV